MDVHFEECWEKTKSESDHILKLGGKEIPYHTVCEDNFFYHADGKPVASIYSYSYFRSDVVQQEKRPVIFAYNGGPGSASLWMHLGLIGPRRIHLEDEIHLPTVPPFELEDNPHCLLDLCDIVVVDMPGTGLGRLFDEDAKEEFYGSDADIHKMALFVDGWLTRYHRHNSQIILAGESYGTGRSCLLAAELLGGGPDRQDMLGISVSGILLLGAYFYAPARFAESVLGLPSMAATCWYHRREGKPELGEFVKEAYRFSGNEYLKAYYAGSAVSEEELNGVIDGLKRFTGLDETYLRRNWMTLPMRDFMKELLRKEGDVVGFYDSRYSWKDLYGTPDSNVIADDAAMGQYTPAFQAGFALLRDELQIDVTRASRGLSLGVNMDWDRKFTLAPEKALAGAMRRNPRLRVMFASGLYDLCTTAGNARYFATHSELDMDRITIGEYPSGHMAYLGEESAELLGNDFRDFVKKSCQI